MNNQFLNKFKTTKLKNIGQILIKEYEKELSIYIEKYYWHRVLHKRKKYNGELSSIVNNKTHSEKILENLKNSVNNKWYNIFGYFLCNMSYENQRNKEIKMYNRYLLWKSKNYNKLKNEFNNNIYDFINKFYKKYYWIINDNLNSTINYLIEYQKYISKNNIWQNNSFIIDVFINLINNNISNLRS